MLTGADEAKDSASKAKSQALSQIFCALVCAAFLVTLFFAFAYGAAGIGRRLAGGADVKTAVRQFGIQIGVGRQSAQVTIEQWDTCGQTKAFDWQAAPAGEQDSSVSGQPKKDEDEVSSSASTGASTHSTVSAKKFGGGKRGRNRKVHKKPRKIVKRDADAEADGDNDEKDSEDGQSDVDTLAGFAQGVKGRVAAGEASKQSEFPWMIKLGLLRNKGKKFQTVCAATLILDRWALTAAQCCLDEAWKGAQVPKKLSLGAYRSKDEHIVDVEKCFVHEGYNRDPSEEQEETYKNDVALLKLKQKLPKPGISDDYQVICLPTSQQEFKENVPFYIAGWGSTSTRNNYTKILMKGEVHLNDPNHFCDDNDDPILEGTQLCTMGLSKTAEEFMIKNGSMVKREARACYGDGGDPLMYPDRAKEKFFMVGMASWAHSYGANETDDKENCDKYNHHSHFQKISSYIDWISDTVVKNSIS